MRDNREREKNKLLEEKKHMADLLREDKERRFGKKIEEMVVVKEKDPPQTYMKNGLNTLARLYPVSRDGDKVIQCFNTLHNILKNMLKDKNEEK